MDYIKKHIAHKFFVVSRNTENVLRYLELRHDADLAEDRVPKAVGAVMEMLSAGKYGAAFDIVYRPPFDRTNDGTTDELDAKAMTLARYKREIINVVNGNELRWLRAA